MNFATLQGLTIPEGIVTEIKDASGRVLWTASKPVKLRVAKQISNTYAGETTYENESFILLNIYPKNENSVVQVAYGDLTKTLTFNGINSMSVYFGTFNGVSDDVSTPESGILTISGDYNGFSTGNFQTDSKSYLISYCGCITSVDDFGNLRDLTNVSFAGCTELTGIPWPNNTTTIGPSAFEDCSSLALTSLPDTITTIGSRAFWNCSSLALTSLPNGITSIGPYAFRGCSSLALTSLPNGITDIPEWAFRGCINLPLTSLPSNLKTIGAYAFESCRRIALTIFPEGLTSIDSEAFAMGDSGINAALNITLPSTLLSVGSAAFTRTNEGNTAYMPICETIKILAKKPPTVKVTKGSSSEYCSSFGYYSSSIDNLLTKIIVPKGCGTTYKAATGWSSYANIIEEAT